MKAHYFLPVLMLILGAAGIDPCLAQNCQASFTFSQTQPNVVNFTSTSTGTNSNTVYQWSFGDSQFGSGQNTSHTYTNPGTYWVCLTIYDSIACQSTWCDTVVVTGNPPSCQANFTWTVNGNTVVFTNLSTPTTGANYYWSFGDAGTSSLQNPVHTYANNGTYNVCLTVWTNTQPMCADTICYWITVGSQTNCNANFTYVINGNTVTFTNTSSGGNNPFYTWYFGDNSAPLNQTNAVHTYPGPGTYTVCLYMQDSTCFDSTCQVITINPSGFGDEPGNIADFQCFPNPAKDLASILLYMTEADELSVELYDLTGRIRARLFEGVGNGKVEIAFHTSNIPAGVYVINVRTAQGSLTKKLTVIR